MIRRARVRALASATNLAQLDRHECLVADLMRRVSDTNDFRPHEADYRFCGCSETMIVSQ
jgi:hypothetical protein